MIQGTVRLGTASESEHHGMDPRLGCSHYRQAGTCMNAPDLSPDTQVDPLLPFRLGDTHDAVRDLHMRLYRVRSLRELPDDLTEYSAETAEAVGHFQQSRSLRVDGICHRSTWDALVESNFELGDRLLYLQKPMTRGDDVEELQRRLGMMGFNAGRVNGIFDADTQAALAEFQRNAGLTVDGICGFETLASMRRIDSHVGSDTVTAVRERERLRSNRLEVGSARIIVGDLGGQRALGDLTARLLRQAGATVAFLEQPDESEQAAAANDFGAHVFIGLMLTDTPQCSISYFAVPQFESEGGKRLAALVDARIQASVGDVSPVVCGMRVPALRETRMPAVIADIGPSNRLSVERHSWAHAISDAILAWLADPDGAETDDQSPGAETDQQETV